MINLSLLRQSVLAGGLPDVYCAWKLCTISAFVQPTLYIVSEQKLGLCIHLDVCGILLDNRIWENTLLMEKEVIYVCDPQNGSMLRILDVKYNFWHN